MSPNQALLTLAVVCAVMAAICVVTVWLVRKVFVGWLERTFGPPRRG